MPTIMDVAREAGVSRSTVSRVLNDKGEVDHRTSERVWEAIRQLNYTPNAAARALARQRTETIGVMLADVSDPFYERIIRGIQYAADEREYSVAFYNSGDDLTDHYNVVASALSGSRVDGLVIVGSYLGDIETLQTLIDRGSPIGLIERYFPDVDIPCLVCNNKEAAMTAVEHLISLGHTRIGCITGNLKYQSALDRLAGYEEALKKRGIDCCDELVVKGDFLNRSGYEGMLRLVALSERPTAVFACNDMMAIGAIRACSEFGVHIPDEVAIVGFDDITFARMVHPQLTTMRQPLFEMGALVTRSLIDRITRGDDGQIIKKVLPAELVIRTSCGQNHQ